MPQQRDALSDLYAQYPGLKRFGVQVVDSSTRGTDWRGQPHAGRKMEFYPPEESYNPNPGKPTIELFSQEMGSKDLMGEVFSHLLPEIDPQFKDARAKFLGSIDDKQKEILRGDYESQLRSGVLGSGKTKSFDEWLSTNGGDAFFRGYVADQYPKEFYRPDQVGMFTPLLSRLQSPDMSNSKQISVKVPGFDQPVLFPAGMSPEQIQQAIENDILPQRKPAAREPEYRAEPGMGARIGRGAQDVVDRLTQLSIGAGEKMGMLEPGVGDLATQAMAAEQKQYESDRRAAKGGDAGIDLARLAGNIGMQAPLALGPGGKASMLSRALTGALQGGTSGALQFDETNSVKGTALNTGLGTLTGAIAGPAVGAIGDKIGKVAQTLAGRAKGVGAKISGEASDQAILAAVPELNELPPAQRIELLAEAKKQIAQMGALDDVAIGRKANLVANDITPTKSMVTRDPADWTLERNLQKLAQSPDEEISGVGRQLTDVYQKNDAALSKKLGSFSEGIPKATQEGYGMTVMQSIDDLATASQKDVGKLYRQVAETKGEQLASDARNLADTLDGLRDNTYAEKLVSSVTNKLRRFGMLDDKGELTAKTLTVTQAEELRKFVNTLPNDFGKKDIIKAIDSDVLSGMGEDAFSGARKAAADRFAMLDNPATQRAVNALGELQQGKTAQSFIKSQVVDAPAQDVKTLVTTIGKITDAAKRKEAEDAMRGGVLSYLQSKAINPNSGQFSGAAFNKALEGIGDEKLALTLGAAEAQKIKSLARAAIDATYQPAFSAVNNSNTAPMLMSLMQKARTIPGVPLLVTDEAQKLAARSGYQNRLAEALAAKSGKSPPVPESIQRLAEALRLSVPQASVATLDQARKPADQKRKERK
jgi:hypothetical protein